MKGVAIAITAFLLGLAVAHLPVQAEERLALSDTVVDSVQRVRFDEISVFPEQVVINHPDIRYAKVASNSMAPLITDKSTVFEMAPDSPAGVRVNDVISFYEPSVDGVVLHLVTEIVEKDGETFYKTRGVANPEEDPWLVPFENVKGVMVGTFR